MNIERKHLLITVLFPNVTKKQRKALRTLADSKNMDWFDSNISGILHDLLGSLLRHRATNYEQIVGKAGKERARYYIQGEVSKWMAYLKGQVTAEDATS